MFKNMKIEINEQQPLDEVVREFYEAGAQSRQAEIDELNKRIDDALGRLYRSHASSKLCIEIERILKGTQS